MESLKRIGKLVREQDNRITDQPMFLVQQKVRDYGYDSAHSFDGHEWIYPDHDHREATPHETKRLDLLAKHYREPPKGWEQIFYKDRWEFVTACFTEQGCKDFLRINGHNLHETRIYADGSYRNEEYRTVRDFLKGLGDPTGEEC